MRSSTVRLGQRLITTNATKGPLQFIARRLPLLPPLSPLRQSHRLAVTYSPTLSSALRFPIRYSSTQANPSSEMSIVDPSHSTSGEPKQDQPAYQLTFTCKPCLHRSSHRVTKQGYHRGTVLITCPSCKNRHVISDHLNIFGDEKSTLEDILRQKAAPGTDLSRLLKKGRLGMREGELVGREGEEDIEFWEDGTESVHQKD